MSEYLFDWRALRRFDGRTRLFAGKGRHIILQTCQFQRYIIRQQVLPG